MSNDLVIYTPPPAVVTSFALEAMRAYFIRQRNMDGAHTPLGHRWSNLIEQTWNLYFAESQVQREHLMCSIAKSTLDIRDIKRGQQGRVPSLSTAQLLLTFQTIH